MNVETEEAEKYIGVLDSYEQVVLTAIEGLSEEDLGRLCDYYKDKQVANRIAEQIEMICKERVKEEALRALPGGFEAYWAMDWNSSDGETVVTDGPDWADGIPEGTEWGRARDEAREYSEQVADSIAAAIEAEQRCRKALDAGDLKAAREAASAAAREERQWGDDPTYKKIKQALSFAEKGFI